MKNLLHGSKFYGFFGASLEIRAMETQTSPHFSLEMSVRDYECDLQGIVNNAVYQNYLEHARHEFLRSIGCSFPRLHELGVDLVVSRIEMDFKKPLIAQDTFVVELWCELQGRVRVRFIQKIFKKIDHQICIDAVVVGAALGNGRVLSPAAASPELAAFFAASVNLSKD